MSKPRKAAAKPSTKVVVDELVTERATPAAIKPEMDTKDETSSNGDKKDIKVPDEASPPKPQSAGASTRDAAQKLLALAMKQEWTPIEQVMKALEKAVTVGGDDVNTTPLAGVLDPVRKLQVIFRLSFIFIIKILV